MTAGRPLRFLVGVLMGWAGLRAVLLWPEREPASAPGQAAPVTAAASVSPVIAVAALAPMTMIPVTAGKIRGGVWARPVLANPSPAIVPVPTSPVPPAPTIAMAAQAPAMPGATVRLEGALPTPLGLSDSVSASRWGGGLFAIARPSGTGGGLGSTQLGGSQIGARLSYSMDARRRIALVGRVATPFEGRGREAALGVEWRPAGLPVRVFAEQRFALDGRGGPSAGLIAGVDRPIGRGVRLEAYGQAGAIGRERVEGFADGAARVTRRLVTAGGATLDMGAGVWGGAQRSAERVDVGPTLGIVAPVGGRRLRLALDWRARVLGEARPGSGPALSLGTDF